MISCPFWPPPMSTGGHCALVLDGERSGTIPPRGSRPDVLPDVSTTQEGTIQNGVGAQRPNVVAAVDHDVAESATKLPLAILKRNTPSNHGRQAHSFRAKYHHRAPGQRLRASHVGPVLGQRAWHANTSRSTTQPISPGTPGSARTQCYQSQRLVQSWEKNDGLALTPPAYGDRLKSNQAAVSLSEPGEAPV